METRQTKTLAKVQNLIGTTLREAPKTEETECLHQGAEISGYHYRMLILPMNQLLWIEPRARMN
jgi:hypothetical protein